MLLLYFAGLTLLYVGFNFCCKGEKRDNMRSMFGLGIGRLAMAIGTAKVFGNHMIEWFRHLEFNAQALIVVIILGYFALIVILGRTVMRQLMVRFLCHCVCWVVFCCFLLLSLWTGTP